MKKFSKVILATVLAAAFGNVSAADDQALCPSVWNLRNDGSTFTHAFRDTKSADSKEGYEWLLASNPFDYNGKYWQTIYIAEMAGVTDPEIAIEHGQHDYNYSVLMASPRISQLGDEVACVYSPDGSNYIVVALNGILSGFRKFH